MTARRTHRLRLLAHLPMVALGGLFMFPFYWLFISAFKDKGDIFKLPPEFLPHPWLLDNFVRVFQETGIIRAFVNSVVIAGGHVALALFLCSLAGYAFAKFPHAPGRDKLFAFVLATMMIPSAVLLIPLFVVMCKLNAVNTYWAMIVPGAASAFGIFWMRQYASENIHNDLLDAARIDGCSEFQIYHRIVLPILKPALAALGIVLVIGIWNNLLWAFIVLRTENMYTLPLVIYLLQGEQRTPSNLSWPAAFWPRCP